VVTLLDAENLFIGHAPVNYCLPCDAARSGRGICLSSVTHMQWPSHLDQKGCKGVHFTALKLWLTLSVPSDQLTSGLHDCFSYPANVNINCSPHSPKPLPCQSPLIDVAARSLFRCHPHMGPLPRESISILLLPLIFRSGSATKSHLVIISLQIFCSRKFLVLDLPAPRPNLSAFLQVPTTWLHIPQRHVQLPARTKGIPVQCLTLQSFH
jgi:hypothetical protein